MAQRNETSFEHTRIQSIYSVPEVKGRVGPGTRVSYTDCLAEMDGQTWQWLSTLNEGDMDYAIQMWNMRTSDVKGGIIHGPLNHS